MFANIIIDISHEKLDKTFQYAVPKQMQSDIAVGMEVNIPFGKSNRLIKGYVLEITDVALYDTDKIKYIDSINKNSRRIEGELIALAGWIKNNYGGTMIQALKTVIPVKQKVRAKEKRNIVLIISSDDAKEMLKNFEKKHNTARARLLKKLLEDNIIDYEQAISKLNITTSVINDMIKLGIIRVESRQIYRNPMGRLDIQTADIKLSDSQQKIVDEITKDYNQGIKKTYLLHGITGSGKTQIYIKLIKMVVKKGMQAIVLIPEISLTYQTVMRFVSEFGDRVSVINSKMSQGERYDQFEKAKNGLTDVMIGPRSALFTPFTNLGFIIIDEEHESTYKSENIPKYHARETAIARAKMTGASVLLGSATPSIDSYYKAKKGEYRLFTLNERFGNNTLPTVYTVDLREELKAGNKSVLSYKLRELIDDRLKKHEQIMLFINRRGYAGFVSCRACGHVMKCPHCDVSMVSHNNGRLVCHYCGYTTEMVKKCPQCGSKYIGGFRAGTQQIEDIVKKEYPQARILRMDMDTTKTKDAYTKILSAFANEEADILIGTQMIVKGHDFKNVTLVGALAADLSLYSNDYHSAERTFQLLVQAAGRAGRANKKGEVVIQTYSPGHYGVICAAAQDYEQFYEQETAFRSIMGYPPISNMLAILMQSENDKELEKACDILKNYAQGIKEEKLLIIGPGDCTIARLNDVYRKVIYMKNDEYEALVRVKDKLEEFIKNNFYFKNINASFDFNPMSTY